MRFNNYFNLPSLESIDFQASSTLGSDLSKVIADAMSDIDKIWESSKHEGARFRKAVADYCKKKFSQALATVMIKDTGIDITSIHFYGRDLKNSAFGLFAVDLSLDDPNTVTSLMGQESGINTSNYRTDKEYLEELNHLVDLLDPTEGKLKSNKYGKNNKRVVHAAIHFDMEFAFMCKYLFVKEVDQEQAVPTADEIAAIMLHEIGHVMSLVEHSFDIFATANRVRESIHGIDVKKMRDDPKAIDNFISEHKKVLNRIKKITVLLPNTQQNKKLSSHLKLMTDAVEKLNLLKITTNGDIARSSIIVNNIVNFIYTLIVNIFTAFILSLMIGLLTLVMSYLIASLTNGINKSMISTDKKSTDRGSGYSQLFLIERWADDYAAHQGYGPELASALNKLGYAFKHILMMFDDPGLRNSSIFFTLNGIADAFFNLPNLLCAPPLMDGIYEDDVRRIERIREDTYAFFRNNNDVPPTLINTYINKIDKLNEQIKKAEDAQFWSRGARETLSKIWFNLTPTGIYSLLKDGNLQKDLDLLNNQVDAMRNNSLYYWSDKFKYS